MALFLAFLASGCVRDDSPYVRQEIPALPFHKIELRADAEVLIYQDAWHGIIAEGSIESLHALDYDFSNGRLTIRDTGPLRSDTRVHLYTPDLSLVENRSRSTITGQNLFITPGRIEITSTRTGVTDLYLAADEVIVRHRGKGNIFLGGETGFLDLKVTDSGSFLGFGLLADQAEIRQSGSGDAEVFVDDFMDVLITGPGNVYYMGYPGYRYEGKGAGQLIHVQ